CNICGCDFTMSHGGRHDVMRHEKSEKHQQNAKHATGKKMNDFFLTPSTSKVTEAEVAFVSMLAEHNLSFSCGDHIIKFIKKFCKDPEVVNKISCGTTKASCIARAVLGPNYQNNIAKMCQEVPFCLYLDKSTDIGDVKLLVILVGYFDESLQKNDMPECISGTGQAMFNCVMESFKRFNIPHENIVAFSSDNAASMTGRNNSVLSRLNKSSNLVNTGSLCHLADICSKSGTKALSVLVEMYTATSSSSQRQQLLKEYTLFVDIEPLKIIKHVPTRCLSLHEVIKHMVDMWDALQSYFLSAESRTAKVELICHPEIRAILLFLKYPLEPLYQFNVRMQAQETQMLTLHNDLSRIAQLFSGRLLKPEAAVKLVKQDDCKVMDSQEDFLCLNEVRVGSEAEDYIHQHEDDIHGTSVEMNIRKKAALFYGTVLDKMIKKFPLRDQLLKKCRSMLQVSAKAMSDLATTLGITSSAEEASQLMDQFSMYQFQSTDDLLQEPVEAARFWSAVLRKMDVACGEIILFKRLVMTVLCLPHLNAEPECAFSMVKKVKTELRQSLNIKTLNSLISIKMNEDHECFEAQQPKELLELAKKATTKYNSKH
uniref:HAT C-terminal dimerisation domain-containing protein n=1 Tax=Latimeria chalumnae TaxID=7897 RepID=H3AES5_LATCH